MQREERDMNSWHEKTTAYYLNGYKLYGWAQSLKHYCEKESSNLIEPLSAVVENTDFDWSQREQDLITSFPSYSYGSLNK